MLITLLLLVAVLLLLLGAFDVHLGKAHAGWLGLAVLAFSMLVPAIGS